MRSYDAARPMLIRHATVARLMIVSTAWARQGFFYRIWSEGENNPAYPADWTRIEATIEQCRHLSPELIERERRSMPAAVFNREYLNQFDSLESRFFDVGSIDAAFGSVIGPTPEVTEDPVRSRQPAFSPAGRAARRTRRASREFPDELTRLTIRRPGHPTPLPGSSSASTSAWRRITPRWSSAGRGCRRRWR